MEKKLSKIKDLNKQNMKILFEMCFVSSYKKTGRLIFKEARRISTFFMKCNFRIF